MEYLIDIYIIEISKGMLLDLNGKTFVTDKGKNVMEYLRVLLLLAF